jgi:hypothetical protein
MWLLPSKGRPANLKRFFEAYANTGGTTPGIVIIDQADAELHAEAYGELAALLPLGWSWAVTAGVSQGEKLAEIWQQMTSCAWLGLIGDDCVPETAGWDQKLVAALDGGNLVSCDDGWQAPKRVGNCWIMDGPLVRAVGYIFPPGLNHLFVDDVWEELGRAANCWHVRMDVKVAHRHVLKGEAAADDTHRLVYGSDTSDQGAGLWPGDAAVYQAWLKGDRHRAIAAVTALRRALAPADEATRIAAREARAKSRSVLICTPSVHPKSEYAQSLFATGALLAKQGVKSGLIVISGSSNLPKARNALAAYFLASEFDDMLLIDDDMEWKAGAVMRLIASDKAVIGAVGRRKTDKVSWCLRFLDGSEQQLHQDEFGALEVAMLGTGMLKISRSAFEQIIAERPDLKHPNPDDDMPKDVAEHYYRFFRFGDQDEGEDYMFSQLWRSVGGQVWVDPEIELGHIGEKTYTGRLGDILVAVVKQVEPAEPAAVAA